MSAASERLRAAVELHEFGVRMQRQRLRRAHPGASAAELDALLVTWLQERPGAEHGDAVGPPSRRFG